MTVALRGAGVWPNRGAYNPLDKEHTWSALQTFKASGLGTTTAPRIDLLNEVPAAAGAQQVSPAIRWTGYGWKTDAVAASQAVEFQAYVLPVQGAAAPTGILKFQVAINGGAYADVFAVTSAGVLNAYGNLAFQQAATISATGQLTINATGTAVFNETGADVDLRVAGDNNANMVVVDAGTDSAAFGAAVIAGAFLTLAGSAVPRTLITAVGFGEHFPTATFTDAGGARTLAIGARVFLGIPTLTNAASAVVFTNIATAYFEGAPIAGANVTFTGNVPYTIWSDSGLNRFDGAIVGATGAGFILSSGTIAFQGSTDITISGQCSLYTTAGDLWLRASTNRIGFLTAAGSVGPSVNPGTLELTSIMTFAAMSTAGIASSVVHNMPIGAGGAANAVVAEWFRLDGTNEAGLLGETDGAGSYTQAKTVWKIPYRDAAAGAIGPTAPTTWATWDGGLRLECSDAIPNGRLYWVANEAQHYVDATAGFNFLRKEPTVFGDHNRWKFGDLMVLKVDRYTEDGGHALPYPLEEGLRETLLRLLDVDAEFRREVKEKLHA